MKKSIAAATGSVSAVTHTNARVSTSIIMNITRNTGIVIVLNIEKY